MSRFVNDRLTETNQAGMNLPLQIRIVDTNGYGTIQVTWPLLSSPQLGCFQHVLITIPTGT
jgi:hypothetical protein